MSRFRAAAASAGLGASLAAVAFAAKGGTDLTRTTIVELVVVLAAGLTLALVLVHRRAAPVYGGAAVALFAAYAAMTALSATWSIEPAESVREAGRTFAYLAVFTTAVALAHLRPRAAPVVVGGVLIAGVAVCAWALVTRVFPAALADGVLLLGTRLSEPFGYSNALGGTAATCIPAALWLGSRRTARPGLAALAYPAFGVLLLTLLLTQSRGALAAAALATLLWLALVPLRLRTLAVILVAAAPVAPIAAWALSKGAFAGTAGALSAREAVAGDFGLMVLTLVAVLTGVGLAVQVGCSRRAPSLGLRRRAGIALAVAACALPLAGLTSVAMSDGGLAGTISDRIEELTGETASTPGGAARLGSVSSARGQYWRQAKSIFAERPLVGRGANTFGLARLPYRKSALVAQQAHGFMPQTLADLGLLGGLAALALLAAWLVAAARATGLLGGRRRRPTWTTERTALLALTLCAVGFGVQSAADWTWFVPGPTVAALVAAGYVAGRGPLAVSAELPAPASEATVRAETPPADAPAPPLRDAPGAPAGVRLLRGLLGAGPAQPARHLAAVALLVTAGLCAWAVWQPERAARATDGSVALLARGDIAAAERQADRARAIDPYSPDPLYARASVLAARGRIAPAYRTLEQAVVEHPRDPDTWLRLAAFELDRLDLPERSLSTLEGARRLDPYSGRLAPLAARAQAQLDAGQP